VLDPEDEGTTIMKTMDTVYPTTCHNSQEQLSFVITCIIQTIYYLFFVLFSVFVPIASGVVVTIRT
jgi:hypothetical protein